MNWLLPFKIIEGRTISQQPQFQGKVLVLPDTDCWFDDLDQKQNLKNINEKIYLALVKLAELHELGWIHGDIKKNIFESLSKNFI